MPVPSHFCRNRATAVSRFVASTVIRGTTRALRQSDINILLLLESKRDYKNYWSTRYTVDARALDKACKLTAATLFQCGEELQGDACCRQCKRNGGAWTKCVVCPVYEGSAIAFHACANCIFSGRASECSLRVAFQEQGGRDWDDSRTNEIVQKGGLLAVIEAERQAREAERQAELEAERQARDAERERQRERRRERERELKRQREREEQEREREQEREAEEERARKRRHTAEPTSARKTKVTVVVSSPSKATTSATTTMPRPVKRGRTMGWSKGLLKLTDTEVLMAARQELWIFASKVDARISELVPDSDSDEPPRSDSEESSTVPEESSDSDSDSRDEDFCP
ncbi:DUF3716 domain-containing protein [Aspergillus clavatus NRRL 1]|uniref:Uncharacterized protein n=1 Tax=Aspergillus clavatus (strain ATCC 1007 / CBS 513.65 / DSM 816 / NCTC 3887 / NRRL 1 / QM 1276 / 107) TaxID=344612 RepID=A1C9N8_ASPCL|nr:uncharacterized protein ACLA_056100 [Aspergillus clavatus NRRL 1]EAW13562.1 hypothetical protein ACLA_056100 [Aspergillus clavatus NRRL 1]